MRTARLPDGRTLQFPDGTPDEVIQATVQRTLQAPPAAPGVPALPQQGEQSGGISGREALQQGVQGLSLGFGDELTAGLAALLAKTEPGEQPFMETFRDILEAERGQIAQTQEQHPVASTALQIGGGLLTGGVGASRAAGAKVLQGAATRGGQIAQGVGRAAAAGVPAGAIFGAGGTEGGLADRAVGAAQGAALGAVGGAALRPVAGAVTGAAKLGAKGIRGAVRLLTKTDADRANATIAKRLIRDDSIGSIRQSLDELGQGATIPDAAGEATRIELERVASLPGTRNSIVKSVTERLNGTRTRIASDVRETFTPGNLTFDETVKQITDKASAKAAPLYARAYATDVNNKAGALKKLLANPRIKAAVRAGVTNVKSKTIDPADPNAAVLQRLQKTADAKNPNLMVWDHAKRALDDLQGEALASGKRSLARDIKGNLVALREVLDDQVPVYGQARKIWAGGQEEANAFEAGTNVLSQLNQIKTGANASVKLFDDLSDAGKQLYRTGVGQDIENTLLTVTDDATESLVSKIAGSPAKRKVLENAMPDAATRKGFMQTLKSEREFTKNAGEALRGSRGDLRKALKDADRSTFATIASNLIAGQFALSGNQFAQLRLVSSLAGKTGSLSDKANALIGKKLTETRGAEIQKTLNEIDRLIRIPKSLKEATGLSPSDTVKFFLDNPAAAQKFNETAAAITAAVAADKRNRD